MTETEMVQVRCLVQVVDGDGRHLPGEVISLPEPQLPALLEQGAVELADEEAGQEPGDTGTDTNETDANLPPKQPARGRSTKKKTRTRKKAGAAKRS